MKDGIFYIYIMNKNFKKFIENARKIHGYKYEYIEYVNMKTPIKISYNGEIFIQNPQKHLLGRCPEKSIKKITTDEFIVKSKELWGNRFNYSKTIYNGSLKNIIIIDNITNIEYTQRANSHLSGINPFKKMTTKEFISLSIKNYGDDYDYSLVNYINYHKKIKLIFKETGEVFEQSPANHFSGYRPERLKKKDSEKFINESNIIHDNKYIYKKTDYNKSTINVLITCPEHGDFEKNPSIHLQGFGCPNCNESEGLKIISKFLNENNILYYKQHKFNDDNSLPFDFYISTMRTAIEFDDKHHYEPIDSFGGLRYYNKLKIINKLKSEYCENNFINLIRIKYNQIDDINKILWDNLKVFINKK